MSPAFDPITSASISSFLNISWQFGKDNILNLFTTVNDDWISWNYQRHVNSRATDKVINGDINNFENSIKNAIQNKNINRVCRLFLRITNECNKLSPISEIGISHLIEKTLVGYSDDPFLIEEGLFSLLVKYEMFVKKWEEKFPLKMSEDGKGLVVSSFFNENDFLTDYNFHSACLCARIYYQSCLKICELSSKNLIRVGNHFLFLAGAGKESPIYSNPYFSRIFLSIVIQIGAKAQKDKTDLTKENMIQILNYANPLIVKESFLELENNRENNYSKMGAMNLFLATPIDILQFKQNLNPIINF